MSHTAGRRGIRQLVKESALPQLRKGRGKSGENHMNILGILEEIHKMVWGPWTLAIFLGVGICFSIRFGFFQVRGFGCWWGATVGSLRKKTSEACGEKSKGNRGDKKQGAVSQLQSVCTALAATVGTGNIAGVATALAAGGPGTLFWMWVSAFIGMITAYAETALGIKSRIRDEGGGYLCGPFLYMERLLGMKGMGAFYAFLCLMCSFGMGSMVQSNAAMSALTYAWDTPLLPGGILFTLLLFAVVWGGVRRIGTVAEKMMPAVSGLYILCCLLVIAASIHKLPGILREVMICAFRPESAAGGVGGYMVSRSIRYGISRGVFSNEAGLGTLAILHGSAEEADPGRQGMWAMFEVFFDTIVLCTMTGLVILCGAGTDPGELPYQGAALASWCFSSCLGRLGADLVSASTAVFAFATIMAWYYIGRQAAAYLSGGGILEKRVYPILFLGAVFAGSQARVEVVWLLSDIWNGLMAFPNLTALLFLWREIPLPNGRQKSNSPEPSPELLPCIKREES